MGIKKFTFDSSLARAFLEFGYEHYRTDSAWIPPLKKDLRAQLSPKYPFYHVPGNSHRHFLATAGNKIVGRVSALVNREMKEKDGTRIGEIGFFECIDDMDVAQDLLDAATGWLSEECGLKRIWGPMNFDIWHGYRFMTRGFGEKLFYGEPYNKTYYPSFFEEYGFKVKQCWNSIEVTGAEAITRIVERGAERYRQVSAKGYRFERFNPRHFRRELDKLHGLVTEAFSGFLGFTPIASAEFARLYGSMKYAINPKFFLFAYDETNSIAGFMGAFLELSDAARAMKGSNRLLPAKAKMLYHRRRTNRIMVHLYGTTRREAARQSGLGRALLHLVCREILAAGYENVVFTLMAQGNKARGLLDGYASDERREYALYELNLSETV